MPLVWGVISGTLPEGLTITSNTLSFTPSATGSFTFIVRVTDQANRFDDQEMTLKIVTLPLPTITTSSLPSGTVNVPYPATTLEATGGAPPLVWQPVGLPFGLQFDAVTATIHGTPTSTGSQNVTFTVNDSTAPFNQTGVKTFPITVNAGLTVETPSLLPSATVGQNYSVLLSASGGTGPGTYTWSITGSPSTPAPGLSLSVGGAITGTPSTDGSFTRTYRVQDGNGIIVTKSLTLNAHGGLTIDTDDSTLPLPMGMISQPYSAALSASGGTGPGTYTWSRASGSDALPDGLALSLDGRITGTPTAAGRFAPKFTVQDRALTFVEKTVSITINP